MAGPRFSLRTLLLAMSYLTAVLFGLLSGSTAWANTIYTVSIGIILIGTLAAFSLPKRDQVFWRGFCFIAWSYLVLTLAPFMENLRKDLLTHRVLEICQRRAAPRHAAKLLEPGFKLEQESEYYYRVGPKRSYSVFGGESWKLTQRTGHSAWAVILGLFGGYVAAKFSRRGNIPPAAISTP